MYQWNNTSLTALHVTKVTCIFVLFSTDRWRWWWIRGAAYCSTFVFISSSIYQYFKWFQINKSKISFEKMWFPNITIKSNTKSRLLLLSRTVLHLSHWPLSMPEYKERIFHHVSIFDWSLWVNISDKICADWWSHWMWLNERMKSD